ncbi:MAG: ATP-dependent helicase [Patescibacteria group bacterium]
MKDSKKVFEAEYKLLNKMQKLAVDTLDGPVMVVAGPGTGKTQILALRIANILDKTDIKGDGVLCLTFTNAAVSAMQARLAKYIGEASEKVNISTFHSFGMKVIEEHFEVLGLLSAPRLLEDTETVIFFDKILQDNEWEYLRPRADSARYFSDLRSLISLLKRERIGEEDFALAIEKEIKFLENDESSISTRGEGKGELKKEIVKQIEGLERSREIVKFIKLYEKAKKDKNVFDYDDVLLNLVKIVEISKEAASDIRERYLYVFVDEHQDSSRVQNEFLKKVWSKSERPDIFVVGDDRQLIYGFSGASIDHFKGFQKTFPDAKIIPLVENYRSTQVILDASHALLSSVMSQEKLKSQSAEAHPIRLLEVEGREDEIVAAGLDIKEKMKQGLNPDDCAILVPKNVEVRRALSILHTMGLSVGSLEALNLFDQEDGIAFLRILKTLNGDVPSLSLSFFDKLSGIEPLEAHKFIAGEKMREFSLSFLFGKRSPTLFDNGNNIERWISKLSKWLKDSKENNLQLLIETIGKELFDKPQKDRKLVSGQEIVDTFLGLLDVVVEKNSHLKLADFVSYLEKLEVYGVGHWWSG